MNEYTCGKCWKPFGSDFGTALDRKVLICPHCEFTNLIERPREAPPVFRGVKLRPEVVQYTLWRIDDWGKHVQCLPLGSHDLEECLKSLKETEMGDPIFANLTYYIKPVLP